MLEQQEWEKINLIICTINRIQDIAKMRKEFLTLLGGLVIFDLADFYLNDVNALHKVKLVDPVVVSRFSKEFNRKFMKEYDMYFGQIDYVKWIFSSHESTVYRESDLINNEIRTKSPFYQDYLLPSGLINVSGLSIVEQGVCIGAITLYRTGKKGDFTDKDIYILKQLMPHLRIKLALEYEAVKFNIEKSNSSFYRLIREYNLSRREIEITELLCNGKSNFEISNELLISVNTVKKHISNIFCKMEVDSRSQLINYLIKNNIELFEED